MSDLQLTWDVWSADLDLAGNDLALDDGLETAVILSLFTDRRAAETDTLPSPTSDRRGWWGDALPAVAGDHIGSKLWLLSREKQIAAVLVRARAYALEALQWLLDDGVAAAVDVDAAFGAPGVLVLAIRIARPQQPTLAFTFDFAWAAEAARGVVS